MARRKKAAAFRTISEVADWLGVETHVLRYWETRFKQIKPVKRAGGRRYYRPADMQLIGGLRKLLHEDGLPIKEAQAVLRSEGVKHVAAMSPALPAGLSDAADARPAPSPQRSKPADEEPAVIQSLTPVEKPVEVEAKDDDPAVQPLTPVARPAEVAPTKAPEPAEDAPKVQPLTPIAEPVEVAKPAAADVPTDTPKVQPLTPVAKPAEVEKPAAAVEAAEPTPVTPQAESKTPDPTPGPGQMPLFDEDTLAASNAHVRQQDALDKPAADAKPEADAAAAAKAPAPQSEPETTSLPFDASVETPIDTAVPRVEAKVEPDIDFDDLPPATGVIGAALNVAEDADVESLSAVLARLTAARAALTATR